MFAALLLLAFAGSSFALFLAWLLFGFFGGILVAVLNAIIQFFAGSGSAGSVLAGSNFTQSASMLVFGVLSALLVQAQVAPSVLFAAMALATIALGLYAAKERPHLFARLLLLPALNISYKLNVQGADNIPPRGGVLLLGNHISWIDWLILQVASPRAVRFVMARSNYEKWYLKWAFRFFGVILTSGDLGQGALGKVSKCLARGEVVALFPEGYISYNGQLGVFQKGFELALQETPVPIVPFYLRGLWGSTFSRAQKRFKEISSRAGKREIIVSFGAQMPPDLTADKLKRKVFELSFSAWEEFLRSQKPLQYQWIDRAKENLSKLCIADSTGKELTNFKFISAVLIFARKLWRRLRADENVAVLLPSSAAGAIANMTLFVLGKKIINLNYTSSKQTMDLSIKKADVKTVITSRTFLERLKLKNFDFEDVVAHRAIFLEDLGAGISKKDKLLAAFCALVLPAWLLKLLYFKKTSISDTATIIFSSGSEGEPKGIELTHKNLVANIKQTIDLLNFRKDDTMINSLPIFHSFGMTVTMFLPLCEGVTAISIPDPTDSGTIGKMVAKYKGSIFFGTSTFFRLYTRSKKLTPLMLGSVRMAIAGAEKLRPDVRRDFKVKFGIDIFEGYGTTETAPVVAVNMPSALDATFDELVFNKEGTVGLPIPGTIVKIVDPDTKAELAVGQDGMIIIGGAQVMKGYYKDPQKTSEAILTLDGIRYYKSGDKGHIDEDGFISITDRYSRFAKIGGEMISLGSTEEELAKIFGEEIDFVAVNVADAKKGETIVLLYTGELGSEDLASRVKASAMIPLMQPSAYFRVDELPKLGSGKSDFAKAKKLATELTAAGI